MLSYVLHGACAREYEYEEILCVSISIRGLKVVGVVAI